MLPTSMFYVLAPMVLQILVPYQLHVSLSEMPGEMVFTWSTPLPTQTSYVRVTSESIWMYFEGVSSLFVDNKTKWYIHTVKAQLVPSTKYTYQVGCEFEGYSESFSVLTPPDQFSSKFLVFGDLSLRDAGFETWEAIKAFDQLSQINAIIMLGDLAYDLNSDSSNKGDEFMEEIQPIVSSIPLMVCAGSHESIDNYHNYLTRFQMPNTQFYYTYTVGFVRFVAIHTEVFLYEKEKLKPMLEYLEDVLDRTQEDMKAYPWLVVYGNRPVYCVSDVNSKACGEEAEAIRKKLEDYLFIYNVDLYVNAHVHNYQRSHPLYKEFKTSFWSEGVKGYVNPRSTVYVTCGAAGSNKNNTAVTKDKGELFGMVSDELSFGVLTAENATHLLYEQVSSKTSQVIDSFWIIKKYKSKAN